MIFFFCCQVEFGAKLEISKKVNESTDTSDMKKKKVYWYETRCSHCVVLLKLPVWKWGPAPEDCWNCLWDKKPAIKRKKTLITEEKTNMLMAGCDGFLCVCICMCTHLLPEVQSPGNVGVGVVLFIGALMELRLDGLCLHRKLTWNCTR